MLRIADNALNDPREIDGLMQDFYDVISFGDGESPDWERMTNLFSSHARITRLTPEGIDYMDLTSFRQMAEELIEVGAFTSFYERETARRQDQFGDVMHVASAYETRISPTAVDFIERGINSLQLIRERGVWRILSLCWDTGALFDARGLHGLEGTEASHGKS